MSVVWVKQRRARTSGDTDKPEGKGQRVYLVLCSTKTDDPDTAMAAADIPLQGASWSVSQSGLKVTQRDSQYYDSTADGGVIYEVTVDYSTKTQDPEQKDPNPLARPIVMAMSFDSFEETIYLAPPGTRPEAVDVNGQVLLKSADGAASFSSTWVWRNAIVNSAGKPFDPTITETFRDPVVTIQKNFAVLPWSTILDFSDSVCKDSFVITYRGNSYPVGKGQGWISEIKSDPQYENGVQFESVTVTLKLREDGWRRKILDQGLEHFDNHDVTAAHPAIPIRANGEPIQTPALLDGFGGALQNASDTPVWLRWLLKKERNFSALPFWA